MILNLITFVNRYTNEIEINYSNSKGISLSTQNHNRYDLIHIPRVATV